MCIERRRAFHFLIRDGDLDPHPLVAQMQGGGELQVAGQTSSASASRGRSSCSPYWLIQPIWRSRSPTIKAQG